VKFTRHRPLVREWTDLELTLLEETALAVAQATIQNAIDDAGITRAEMARRMGCSRSFVTRIMQGDHNLTVKTLARALGTCGRQVILGVAEPQCTWMRSRPQTMTAQISQAAADPDPAEMPRFDLPWPPSANHYWRSLRHGPLAGRVLISREGRAYRHQVARSVLAQGCDHRLDGSLEIEIIAEPPDRRARDLDNLLKPTLDALVHSGVVEDDKYFDRITIARGAVVPGGKLRVMLRQLRVPVIQEGFLDAATDR